MSYWLDAVNEHSLHSPFLYDFYTRVIRAGSERATDIERLRRKLCADTRTIRVNDLGSGNRTQRRVAEIARTSITPRKYSELFARIIDHINARSILELGTSFGINTLYLARRPGCHVATFEGSDEIAAIAALTFEFANARNIQLIRGNIDNTLATHLQSVRTLDFVYLDANHRYEPTLQYFHAILPRLSDKSIVVVDDIHSSREMERAWAGMKRNKLVYASADLFRCGILFFDPSLNKQHVILQV